jgi:50S ribosomal protein L16 3-hydroxylase
LVQAVNQLHPSIHTLLDRFRFIPNWRIDDVMVSYAADQGSVGPHFDYYDVFLLQASGKRRWRLGQTCSSTSLLRPDTECKILQEFVTSAEWLVEPGDLLYIPPGLAHWGVAEGECMTYSIGFRAPSHSDILLDYAQERASTFTEDQRFSDPDRAPCANPGLIAATDLAEVRAILQQSLLDDELIASWFGRFMTQPSRDSLRFDLDSPYPVLAPGVRAAYRPQNGGQAVLYINGEEFHCSLVLAQTLCAGQDPLALDVSQADHGILGHLTDQGYLV